MRAGSGCFSRFVTSGCVLPPGWRRPGQFEEFPREMGLVGIAAGCRDIGPAFAFPGERLGVPKANDARDCFRRQPDSNAETVREVLAAHIKMIGKAAEAQVALAADKDIVGGFDRAVARLRTFDAVGDECRGEIEPRVASGKSARR